MANRKPNVSLGNAKIGLKSRWRRRGPSKEAKALKSWVLSLVDSDAKSTYKKVVTDARSSHIVWA